MRSNREGAVPATTRGARLRSVLAGSALLLATITAGMAPEVASAHTRSENADALHGGEGRGVRVVGHTNMGTNELAPVGLNGHVAVLNDHAYVGSGTNGGFSTQWNRTPTCKVGAPPNTVKVVSLADPSHPTVVTQIPIGEQTAPREVEALHVATPAFTGDLLAVAVESCTNLQGPGAVTAGVFFYDVTNPALPVLLSRQARVFAVRDVSLVQRPDGKVLAVIANQGGSITTGGIFVLDVTNPRNPVTVGNFLQDRFPKLDKDGNVVRDKEGNPVPAGFFSEQECRPFHSPQGANFNADGSKLYGAFQDQGLLVLDPTAGEGGKLPLVHQSRYSSSEEGNSFRFVPNSAETVGLATDEDLMPAKTTLTIASGIAATTLEPGGTSPGVFRGCEALWGNPFYNRSTTSVTAEIVLGGPDCNDLAFLGREAEGKIAVVNRGCSFEDIARAASRAGAAALLIANTGTDHHAGGENVIFSPDSVTPANTNGATIPVIMITKEAKVAIEAGLDEAADPKNNLPPLTATLADKADTWGALRVFDISGGAKPAQVSTFNAPHTRVLTTGEGLYHAVNVAWEDDQALVAWMSDGFRVVDVSNPAAPEGRAYFVPPAAPDPTLNYGTVPLVVGVAKYGEYVVVSDINGGLYVLDVALRVEQCLDGGHARYGFADEVTCRALFDTADLAVTQSDFPDPATLGEEVTYTVEVTNNGPGVLDAASGVNLTDVLPAGSTFVSATPSQGTCSQASGRVTCSLGSLGVGATATVAIVVEPSAVGIMTNSATASGNEGDLDPDNNTATESTVVENSRGCTIIGTPGHDVILGTEGDDVICALGGNDTVLGSGGRDSVFGDSGNDVLDGGKADDAVKGGKGDDTVRGDAGRDSLSGGAGADTLAGGAGDDSLDGVDGVARNDHLNGEAGADACSADPGDTTVSC